MRPARNASAATRASPQGPAYQLRERLTTRLAAEAKLRTACATATGMRTEPTPPTRTTRMTTRTTARTNSSGCGKRTRHCAGRMKPCAAPRNPRRLLPPLLCFQPWCKWKTCRLLQSRRCRFVSLRPAPRHPSPRSERQWHTRLRRQHQRTWRPCQWPPERRPRWRRARSEQRLIAAPERVRSFRMHPPSPRRERVLIAPLRHLYKEKFCSLQRCPLPLTGPPCTHMELLWRRATPRRLSRAACTPRASSLQAERLRMGLWVEVRSMDWRLRRRQRRHAYLQGAA
mmetsp:Transcript_18640/g.42756  ORF Transcript_18640/g.42756 Transcript_18640/m.42756 type:complete len:285 (-) Transcript_18640:335-1189(-)